MTATRYDRPEYDGDSRPETQKHIDQVNEFGKGFNRKLKMQSVLHDMDSQAEPIDGLANEFSNKLGARLVTHDASKLVEPECKFFDKGTPNLAKSTYGEESYDKAKDSIREGIEHHYLMNDHHPEHFGAAGVSGMNLYQLVEMYLDWRAAALRHEDGNIFKSIHYNRGRFKLDPQLYDILLNTAIVDDPGMFGDAPDEVKEYLNGKV